MNIIHAVTIPMISLALFSASNSYADIYKFVTVDGVESFTDTPVNKNAKIVIKDSLSKKHKSNKTGKVEKVHDISLNEVVEKAAKSYFETNDSPEPARFEPRLPAVGGVVTSGVGMRVDPIDGKLRHHNGIDIAIPEGTPVKPVTDGTVVFSGQRPGYGYTVLIEHNNGMVSLYGHNSRLAVAQGQRVDSNTVIAFSGNTGRSTGPHLHFEAWQSGVNVTPAFMPGSKMQIPESTVVASKSQPRFRKEILADGTILFTNLPATSAFP